MPASSDIYGQIRQPEAPNRLAQLAQMAQLQGVQDQSALAQYGLKTAQRNDEDNALLRAALSEPGADPSAVLLKQGRVKEAGEYLKSRNEADKSKAETGHLNAQTGQVTADTQAKMVSHLGDAMSALINLPGVTPSHVVASLQSAGKTYGIPDAAVQQAISQVPQDPAALPAYLKAKNAELMTAKERMAYIAPDANTVATNETHVKTTGMTNAISRSNNAANIAKDFKVAGMNPDGTSTGANDSMVDAIGQYKVQPPNGMALRNPRMQQILAEVTSKYPDFDATTYGARQQAAKSFSTGKDAQNVQSANTALNHLDTIEQLALAQKNGDVPLFNKLANGIAAQTGQPAPTNLRAAILMVAPEITKAVHGAGGGVGERADMAHSMNPNGSPEQILGGVGTIKELMGGRLSEVERTYNRSTGRKDFRDTYLSPAAQKMVNARDSAGAGGAAGVPADIAAILAAHGPKKGQ